MKDNELIVAQGNNNPALFISELTSDMLTWISGTQPNVPLKCTAKIRYRQKNQECKRG